MAAVIADRARYLCDHCGAWVSGSRAYNLAYLAPGAFLDLDDPTVCRDCILWPQELPLDAIIYNWGVDYQDDVEVFTPGVDWFPTVSNLTTSWVWNNWLPHAMMRHLAAPDLIGWHS